ncbi:MAG: ATP-dependent RecD-like DNA helicase [Candidatus Eisenbacteria sp.]|nr:ATP-dependent RecD-like DNA helicase [Candidatus Eisenbacteria bacterium]
MAEEGLEGVVQRITFHNPENDYTVARVQTEEDTDVTTVVGNLPGLTEGEQVSLTGNWAEHPRYGRQFKATGFHMVTPTSVQGIRKFLASGAIRGVGPEMAKRLTGVFGEETLDIIDKDPDRLLEIPGIGKKKKEDIVKSWRRKADVRDLLVFLHTHGISGGHAGRIHARFASQSIRVIQQNPYVLADEVWGIGFLTADRMARKLGVDPESPDRIASGLRYTLRQAVDQGHVWLPREELTQCAAESLAIELVQVEQILETLPVGGEVVIEDDRVYLSAWYRAEVSVAKRLLDLAGRRCVLDGQNVDVAIEAVESRRHIVFDERQKEAVKKAVGGGLFVLTGGPGTGKTTITQAIIDVLESMGKRVLLAAPTGRASKKLSEVTGRTASTIHRLLEYNAQSQLFGRNEARPLVMEFVIIDEQSMVDLMLMDCLLRAIPAGGSLILVGDSDQLPSVGAGNVLADILASGRVRSVKLEHIFRQMEQSMIVLNAHRINNGEYPRLGERPEEFAFVEAEDAGDVPDLIQGLCKTRLPAHFGLDPVDDIQVLSPMYRGPAGVRRLNEVLQQALNPEGVALTVGGQRFRQGDKVMQIRNNYDKEVFNGDLGRIIGTDEGAGVVHVSFDTGIVSYRAEELDELVLAYAATIHKAQGSEYRAVVIPLVTQHYIMLQRNLLYTAITRARELVVLVGSKRAIGIAVRNDRAPRRYSFLGERLRG